MNFFSRSLVFIIVFCTKGITLKELDFLLFQILQTKGLRQGGDRQVHGSRRAHIHRGKAETRSNSSGNCHSWIGQTCSYPEGTLSWGRGDPEGAGHQELLRRFGNIFWLSKGGDHFTGIRVFQQTSSSRLVNGSCLDDSVSQPFLCLAAPLVNYINILRHPLML